MKKAKTVCAAILLSSCIAWIGCNDRNDRSGDRKSSPAERGAPNNPQGPSGPR
jgi:hypothetical protein